MKHGIECFTERVLFSDNPGVEVKVDCVIWLLDSNSIANLLTLT